MIFTIGIILLTEKYPAVLMHGFGDDPSVFVNVISWLKSGLPDLYVHNLNISGEYSMKTNIDVQCQEI